MLFQQMACMICGNRMKRLSHLSKINATLYVYLIIYCIHFILPDVTCFTQFFIIVIEKKKIRSLKTHRQPVHIKLFINRCEKIALTTLHTHLSHSFYTSLHDVC
jgi:hypothetical protein